MFFLLLFCNYFPFENEMALQLYKVESSLPEDALFQVWLKLEQGFWRRRHLNFTNVFLLFLDYLPLKIIFITVISTITNRDHVCQSYKQISPNNAFGKRILEIVNDFLLFHNNFLLEKTVDCHFNKLASSSIMQCAKFR